MKTFTATPATIKREWCVVDATDKTLGRLASELAHRLRGKHKPEFTPNMDTGDHMVVVNAEKIKVTGKKLEDKIYYRYTGYIGNMKSINLGKLLETHPERAIQNAVKACCLKTLWAGPCFVSCMSMQVRNTRTRPSNRHSLSCSSRINYGYEIYGY